MQGYGLAKSSPPAEGEVEEASNGVSSGPRHAYAEARGRIEGVLDTRAFHVLLQPVAELRSGCVIGAEALSRFTAEPERTPDLWFAEAWRVGLGVELELAALRAALALHAQVPEGAYLAVNLSPRTLQRDELLEELRSADGSRLVLELTEHDRVDDYETLCRAAAHVRALGVRIAVDDAGAGFASFQHILNLRPDIIKLDRELTRAVDRDAARYALASALVTFAASVGAEICAEGIETVGELETLQRLGVRFGQGYLLGRPALPPAPPLVPLPRASSEPADPAEAARLSQPTLEVDAAFDRFTRLTSRLLGSAAAVLSLVEGPTQIFRSAVGLTPPWAHTRAAPLARSFCEQTVSQRAPLTVDDARVHPHVRAGQLVPELNAVAYAGVPLVTSAGEVLGVLCAIEPRPRAWSEVDVENLEELAAGVVSEIERRQAVRLVHEQDESYRVIFEGAAVGVLVTDSQAAIIRVNPRLCEMLGFREEQLLGTPLVALKHPEDAARDMAIRAELLAGARSGAQVETRYRNADGTWRWVRVSASAMRSAEGVRSVALVEDVEESRRAKEALRLSEERYRALARSLPNASVALFDHDLRFVLAEGDALFDTMGLTSEQIRGRTLAELASPENFDRMARAYRAALAGGRHQIELRRGEHTFEVHTTPLRNDAGAIAGGMVLTYDISKLKRTEEALREESGLVALLHDVAVAANSDLPRSAVFEECLRRVCRQMGWAFGHVFVREGTRFLSEGAWYPGSDPRFEPFRAATASLQLEAGRAPHTFIGQVIGTGRTQSRIDMPDDPTFLRADAARASGLQSGIAVPVFIGDEVVAVFELFSTRNVLPTARMLTVLHDVGVSLGRVIERERHATALRAMAVHDELTGLLNRRGFLDFARRQQQLALRAHSPFAVLFLDLNGMKAINDRLGHEVGDRALKEMAILLRSSLREVDLVARLGGDEFVALAVDAGAEHVPIIEARIRKAVVDLNASGAHPFHISVSIGATVFDAAAPVPIEAMLVEADARMYAQKRLRRDPAALPVPAGRVSAVG